MRTSPPSNCLGASRAPEMSSIDSAVHKVGEDLTRTRQGFGRLEALHRGERLRGSSDAGLGGFQSGLRARRHDAGPDGIHEHSKPLSAPGVRGETTTIGYEGCVC